MSSSSSPQHALARRAFIEDVKQDKKGWLKHGVAALAVTVLGLGVAGSLALTGNAQGTSATVHGSGTDAAATGVTTTREADGTSRSVHRAPLDAAKVKSLADQRAEELTKDDEEVARAATSKAAQARDRKLKSTSVDTRKQAEKIVSDRKAAAAKPDTATSSTTGSSAETQPSTAAPSDGKTCLPAASYSVAARFGQVGSWARYHTGFDFAAPIGTPLRAPASGVVTNAGSGPASGWAGNYVAIRYPDGTQSLMAHMSTVSVSVGQSVSGCQVVGAIGMTGRTFGPHVHFEIYPAGVTPGDVYRAVDPVPWLQSQGLHP